MGDQHMLFFGFGFCAEALAPLLLADGWRLSATTRDPAKAAALEARGVTALAYDALATPDLSGVTHALVSPPPTEAGDPVLADHGRVLAEADLNWLGYLSTTGVYGDHQGRWIDEDTPPGPLGARGQRRVRAEAAWLDFAARHDVAVNLFRLAGIYGPGRNQLASVKNQTARRVIKPGQVFSRIHVDDIAAVLLAALSRAPAGRAYSVCDDAPAPPQDVVAFAADLLGVAPPPEVAFEDADLSEMGRSFYAENKRLKNTRLKDELGVTLKYPTYREGLRALFRAGAY